MVVAHGTQLDFDEMVSMHKPSIVESEVRRVASNHGLELYSEITEWDIFTAYVMCMCDYPKSITNDETRYIWVAEYFSDPDGDHCKLFKYFFY